jgi:hypothetical protein
MGVLRAWLQCPISDVLSVRDSRVTPSEVPKLGRLGLLRGLLETDLARLEMTKGAISLLGCWAAGLLGCFRTGT